jgi:hypothetical protein
MTSGNRQLAAAAKDYAARSDGLRRREWLCCSVALGTTSSVHGATKVLDAIELRDVKSAAQQLLAELSGTPTGGSNAE